MTKRKKNMFKCPFCGFVSWETRLETSHYPLELVKVQSDGRGLIKHIFFEWDAQHTLHPIFKGHFYSVLDYLLRHKYIDASTVKNLADIYVKAPEVFHPDAVFDGDVVYKQDVIFNPKIVD